MTYKDPDKQREANRQASQRRRDREGMTNDCAKASIVIPDQPIPVIPSNKRGKDIKCFADLPPDVQQTIDSLSMVDGKICQRVKANRTAIAINYQHLFPDRFNSTGVAV